MLTQQIFRVGLLSVLLLSFIGFAKSPEPVSNINTTIDELSLAKENISLAGTANDQAIESRLKNIFSSIDALSGLHIEVKNGIVFLSGVAAGPAEKLWVENTSKKLEGVIAVVNRITLKEKSWIDVSSAKHEVTQITDNVSVFLPYLVTAVLVFFIFLIFFYAVLWGSRSILRQKYSSQLFVGALSKVIAAPVLILALYFLVRVSGLEGLAATILGGTGILGLMIGLSLKGAVENYISSILISLKKIFRQGDLIEILDHVGVVQSVSTSGTTLMDLDGNSIVIPNKFIFSQVLKNYTLNPKTRITVTVGIGYDDSIDFAREIILKQVASFAGRILDQPEPLIFVDSLGSSTVNLLIHVWINIEETSQFKMKSHLTQKIKAAFMEEGISMPDDAREVIFPQGLQITHSEQAPQETHAAIAPISEERPEQKGQSIASEDLDSELSEIKDQASEADEKTNETNVL